MSSALRPDAPDILKTILVRKQEEVALRNERKPLAVMRSEAESADPVRGFATALDARISAGNAAVIAEIKRASPSKGLLREHFVPAEIATSYAEHGASALSVLTDESFFQGADAHLVEARDACRLPAIRKDFLIDPYQVYEARALGADCVLLIVAALDDARLRDLHTLATELQLDVLVEIHDGTELERAMALEPSLLGINNRDLRTFHTTLDTTIALMAQLPEDLSVVTESGIHSREDVALMRSNGVHGFLVGEAFMRADDPGEKLAALFG